MIETRLLSRTVRFRFFAQSSGVSQPSHAPSEEFFKYRTCQCISHSRSEHATIRPS
jgi:hypothetical protein